MAIGTEEREKLRAAWNGHCDALKQVASEAIDGVLGDPADGGELAELLRSIARLAAMSLQHRLDFNDPDFPLFLRQMDDRYRYGGPDNNIAYFMAALRGNATYRLRGNNGGEGRSVNIGRLWHDDIATAANGDFEVIVSAEEHPGNWTPIAPGLAGDTSVPDQYPTAGNGITVRRYDWDWDRDLPPGWLTIERIDPDAPAYPPALSADRLADQIANATRLFLAAARWWNQRAANVRADNPANIITPPSTEPPGVRNFKPPMSGGKAWLYYGIICLDLAEDEAILIETDLPDGPYWSFTLYNMWWEAPDIMNRQTSLNARQAHVDGDGKARFVISARDPGVPNWLDTGGARRGFLHYRWFRPDQAIPTPVSRLLKVDAVRGALPADHPAVDAHARRATLSKRREQLARRFQR
ncbi:DUF1214 domain-containing protein [Rhizorhabdus histidinilytica]|uniref:DUF1214 domain-containing protein n=1 Tax=Rhizorhabdus histidinilytica TaxID=439228 RepID=UPI0032205074